MRTIATALMVVAFSTGLSLAGEISRTTPLAYFRFNGNDKNEGKGDASFDLKDTKFEDGALVINGHYEHGGSADGHRANCTTPELDRTAFTVILRVKPSGLAAGKHNLITGGTSHRWFGLTCSDEGKLQLTLNNQSFSRTIDNSKIEDGSWITIAATVDISAHQARVWLNGKPLDPVKLPDDFAFRVGKDEDRVWSFTNYSYGGTFQGLVDELMIFNGVLSDEELAKLPLVQQVQPDPLPASAPSELAGEWKNTNPEGGVTKIAITQENETWKIQAWGQCSPQDCDWGRIDLQVFGDSIGDQAARYGLAHWDKNYSDTYMTVRIDRDQLLTDTYTIFKDKSGRANYRSVATLDKADATATPDTLQSAEVKELFKTFHSDDGEGFYQAANQVEAVLDADDPNAARIAEQLLTQLGRITNGDAEVATLFAELTNNKQQKEAAQLLVRVMKSARTVMNYKQGSVVVGQLVVDDGKTDPELVMGQMPISSTGYFAGEVGDLQRPISFRAQGYSNLDVPLAGKKGDVVSVGKIVLKHLNADEQATLKGKVTVDGAEDAAGAKVHLSVSVGPLNTPHNGYSPRRRWPEGIEVPVDKNGEFTIAGLSPCSYYLRITAPDHVDQAASVNFKPGETRDGGEYRLFNSDLGFYLGKEAPPAADLVWESDYTAALKRAKDEQKPLLIMMTATWCGPCKMLDKETLHNPWVSSFLSPFVLLKAYEVDEVEKKYGLSGYPTLVFADSEGEQAHKTVGYQPAAKFAGECARAFKSLKMDLPVDLQTLVEKKVVDAD